MWVKSRCNIRMKVGQAVGAHAGRSQGQEKLGKSPVVEI